MIVITETDVVRACQTLFGKDIDITRDFLYYSIQPSGVKSAYRKKAKETHPDLFAADSLHIQKKQTALFRDIMQAYDVLNLFFRQREQGAWRPVAQGRPARPSQRPAQSRPEPTAPPRGDDVFYRGRVPERTLQIGQYLYFRGKISFGSLIKALVWQRKQRPTIGDIAVQWGLLDAKAVDRIFSVCGRVRLFGEKAVELGLLSVFQVNTILLYQRSQQDRLGSYFVRNEILNAGDLERLVQELQEHNARVLAARKRRRQSAFA